MIFQIDIGIKRFFQNFLNLPAEDILISSVDWAFRERMRQVGSVRLPFLNYRLLPGQLIKPEGTFPKNYAQTMLGVWDDDLKDKVMCKPFVGRYESIFWATGMVNTVAVYQKAYTQNFQDNLITYDYIIQSHGKNTTYTFSAPIQFVNLVFDPRWEAQQEIEQGKIHTIDFSFEISAFLFTGKNVILPTEVEVDLFYQNSTELPPVTVGTGGTIHDGDPNQRIKVEVSE